MTTILERLDLAPAPWRQSAACAGVDPELFHPDRGPGERKAMAAAKSICANCPVQRECLEAALEQDDRYGIRGGLLPDEREQLRRERGMTRRSLSAETMRANRERDERLLRQYDALLATQGNTLEMSRELGMSVDALNKRMERARKRRGRP